MRSADNVVALRRARDRRDREEIAFLPAALEIVETPPSPIGRAIALVIVLTFCLALAWASWGKVDIIAAAPGKIVPVGRTKVVQAFEAGVVRAIHVQDGQKVSAGDLLIELDPRINEAEQGHLQSDLTAAELDIARLEAALSEGSDPVANFKPPPDASPSLVAMQRQFLFAQASEHRAKLAALEDQKRQKEAERMSVGAMIAKLQAVIPVVQQRVDIRKILVDGGNGSKLTYLESLQMLIENQNDLLVQRSRLREAEAALATISDTLSQTQEEYRRALFTELAEARRKAEGLIHDLDKVTERKELQRLTAPADGVVQQLAIHTIGGVVAPAQPLLVVVPSETRLEIEAMLSNRDIGFVHAGQKAEIKIDTFNFTRYGVLHGEVLSLSQDAIIRNKPQDKNDSRSPGAADSSSEPSGQELNYVIRVSFDRSQMQVDDKLVDLSPGMAVTVEIKTGSRSVLSYLLSPLMRYGHESLRER